MQRILTCTGKKVTAGEFVEFWKQGYATDPDKDDQLYSANIERFAPVALEKNYPEAKRLLDILFHWKNGGKNLSGSKKSNVGKNWQLILDGRLPEIVENPSHALQHVLTGGAVYRIFFLHCCLPHDYPIYDRHVHRAMAYIENWESDLKLPPLSDEKAVTIYLERYCGFWKDFIGKASVNLRDADRALWTYGKLLSESPWIFADGV